MLPALWVAKTGLSAQDTNLSTISNNLANVSTTGFKRDRAAVSYTHLTLPTIYSV